jgi:peptidoglycan/xylan/chitin deacetylase (PgdA/CDA1 family)
VVLHRVIVLTVLSSFLLSGRVSRTPLDTQGPAREVAVTVDDLPTASVVPQSLERKDQLTRDLLGAMRRHKIPAIGFVNEGKLYVYGKLDDRRVALLRQWVDGGFELGNHTYSHLDLHHSSAEAFQADIELGAEVTRKLLDAVGRAPRYFRHPYLHTGRLAATRDSVTSFLRGKGYRVAPVTFDNYDYVFAAAFDRARGDETGGKIAAAYVDYMESVVAYYEQQSVQIVGREIRQILLIHANALNARAFDALAARLEKRGYRFISLDRALEDEAYTRQQDEYFGAAGITWLHRWAITQKQPATIFAGEPVVPQWIEKAADLGSR